MQPLQINLSTPISDSCSNCFCCFPKKDKKDKKDKTKEVGENYFMEKKIDGDYETTKVNVSKASKSDTSTF